MSRLCFGYQLQPLRRRRPPTLPEGAGGWDRPFAPVTVFGRRGWRRFNRALLDTGADSTSFSADLPGQIGGDTFPGDPVRHCGVLYPTRRGAVRIRLNDGLAVCTWGAEVVCCANRDTSYPLLGLGGCLQFMDATFFGSDRVVQLVPNRSFSGTVTGPPLSALSPASLRPTAHRLCFDYQPLAERGGPPRPVIPVRLLDLAESRELRVPQAWVDTGSTECLFPLSYARQLGLAFVDDGTFRAPWGAPTPFRFAYVQFRIGDGTCSWTWPALVRFIDAALPVPLLGQIGFLQYLDATFRGADHRLELVTNCYFPSTTTPGWYSLLRGPAGPSRP